MQQALARIETWPVTTAAAAVVSETGVVASTGPVDRLFDLASVTKPLSALTVLLAVEEGAFDLDDPLAELVDTELAEALPGATVRHLLAHASGMSPDSPARAAAVGTRRIYSNAGFDVLGEIVAAATGMPFTDYLTQGVFAPLGMRTASCAGSPARDGKASVADLVPVASMFLAGRSTVLDASTLASQREVQFPGLPGVLPGFGRQEDNAWGLGVEIRGHKIPHWTGSSNSPATFGHFGQSGTLIWVDPEARLSLIVLTDRDFGPWAAEAWPPLSDAVLRAWAAS